MGRGSRCKLVDKVAKEVKYQRRGLRVGKVVVEMEAEMC